MAHNNHTHLFKNHIDMPEHQREKVIALLNQHLANTLDLASQVKQAHWNVKGMNFIALHELFDKHHEHLEDAADMIAERVTALGGVAMGTARMVATESKIAEYSTKLADGEDHVKALVERYGVMTAAVRKAIDLCGEYKDAGTQDLFTEISRDLDQDLWFLEAHIQSR